MQLDAAALALIEQTWTYRWVRGDYRQFHRVHHWPPTGWSCNPWLTMVCPHDGPYEVRNQGEATPQRIEADDVVLVPAMTSLQVDQRIAGRQSYAHLHFTMLGGLDPLALVELPRTFRGQAAVVIRAALLEVCRLHRLASPGLADLAARKAAAFHLAALLLARGTPRAVGDLAAIPRLRPVLEYIEAHLDAPLRRDALAVLCDLSPTRFGAVFKHIMGTALQAYIIERRQRRALDLLHGGDRSIADIAAACGYCDQFEFSRQFHKRWGNPPSLHRRLLRQDSGSPSRP